ncbi:hypothetical protein H4V96_001057 [Janthinobacterium sp. CG_23.4]|nr:hypothetical protein [Janthinobacterium sp. CG_23.4]
MRPRACTRQRRGQARSLHGFLQVVKGADLECLQRVLVESRAKNDVGHRVERGQKVEAGAARHLHVEQQ